MKENGSAFELKDFCFVMGDGGMLESDVHMCKFVNVSVNWSRVWCVRIGHV